MNNVFKKSLVALALAGVASTSVANDESNRGNAQPLFGEVHVSTQYQDLVVDSGTQTLNAVAAADFIVVLDREYAINDEIVFEFSGAQMTANSMPEEISFQNTDSADGFKGMTIGILNRSASNNTITYRVTDLVGSSADRTTGLAVNFSMRNGGWDSTNQPTGMRPSASAQWNTILKGGGNRNLESADYRPATFEVGTIQPEASVKYTMYQQGNRNTVLDSFTEGLFLVRSQINPIMATNTALDAVVDVYEDRRQFVCGTDVTTPGADNTDRSDVPGNTGQNGDCGATAAAEDNTFNGEFTDSLVLRLSGFNDLTTGFNRGVFDIQNQLNNRTLLNQTPTYQFVDNGADFSAGMTGDFSNRNAGYFAYMRSVRYTVEGDFRWLRNWMDNQYPTAPESARLSSVFNSIVDVSCMNAAGFADRPQQAAVFSVSNSAITFTCAGWGEPEVNFDLTRVIDENDADFKIDHIPTNDFNAYGRLSFDLDVNNGRGAYAFNDVSVPGHIDRDDAILFATSNVADAGEWTINGHQTFVPFMPINGDAEAVVVLTNLAKEHSSSAVAANRSVVSGSQRYTDEGYGLVEVTVTDRAGHRVTLEIEEISSQGVIDISDSVNSGVSAAVAAGDLEGGQFALEIFVASTDSDVQVYTAYRTAEGENFVQNDSLHIREVRERSRERAPQTGRDGYSSN